MSTTEPSSLVRSSLLSADDPVARSAVRKVTGRLIPLIALGYGTAYMDRVNISFAALQMNRDLHFSATIYGLGAGLFFLSYSACEIPSNLLPVRFGARRWLSRIMLTWGLLAIGMMLVRTPMQFYVVRFLLGVAEAGFFPGIVFYLMQWFPPDKRARAISGFYVAFPLSSVVMGSLAGALLGLQGRLGLAGWQWLFLVEGLPALVLSLVFWRCLPDSPHDAAWLTPSERAFLLDVIQADADAGVHREDVSKALRDPRVLEMGLLFLCMLGATYAYAFSAPAILQRLTGLSIARTGFLIAAAGLVGALAMVLNAWHSDRVRERYWHVILPFLIMGAGYAIGGASSLPWIAVPALLLSGFAHSSIQGPLLSIPPTFLKGKSMAGGIAAINMIGMFGGFFGPYWMGVTRDFTGDYQRGILTLAIPCLIAAGITAHLYRRHLREMARLSPRP